MTKEISRPGFRSRIQGIQGSELGSFTLNYGPFPYLSIPSFQNVHLAHAAISTRAGGVSRDPYQSLNLAYHVEDDPEAVSENRIRFCKAIDMDVGTLVLAQQAHGDRIVVIDDSQAGSGAFNHDGAIPGTDAMITSSASVALAVLTADCVPVLVLDPGKKAVGIAHAGWRGLLQKIVFKTMAMMSDTFGTDASDCLAALGPSIGPCCYTVSEDVINAFERARQPLSLQNGNSQKLNRLDLKLIARTHLINAGVKEENILAQQICTSCRNDLFYSYRADGGVTGRMMSVIRLMYD